MTTPARKTWAAGPWAAGAFQGPCSAGQGAAAAGPAGVRGNRRWRHRTVRHGGDSGPGSVPTWDSQVVAGVVCGEDGLTQGRWTCAHAGVNACGCVYASVRRCERV